LSDIDDVEELASLVGKLPREIRLVIYGQIQAHITIAGINLSHNETYEQA